MPLVSDGTDLFPFQTCGNPGVSIMIFILYFGGPTPTRRFRQNTGGFYKPVTAPDIHSTVPMLKPGLPRYWLGGTRL